MKFFPPLVKANLGFALALAIVGVAGFLSCSSSILLAIFFLLMSALFVNMDLRARLKTERELSETQGRLRHLITASPAVLYSADPASLGLTYISENLKDLTGYESKELVGDADNWVRHIHPDDIKRAYTEISAAAERGYGSVEFRFRHRDGQFIWVLDELKTFCDQVGAPLEIVGCCSIITEKKELEEELRESERRYRSLYEDGRDVIFTLSPEGILSSFNPAFEAITGWQRQEWLDKSFEGLIYPEDLPHAVRMVRLALGNNILPPFELRVLTASGGQVVADIQLAAQMHEGCVKGLLGIARDVTFRKQAEAEMQKAKEMAEAAARTKSEFLANMSHEIRTPMNAIIGMADLLMETPLTREQKEYVEIFRRSGEGLLRIINDVLDFSKIEAGRLELEEIEFNLQELIENATEILALRAHEKGLELAWHVDPGVPSILSGDPNRLRQVIVNLAGNAVKFTEKGEIVLNVEKPAGEDQFLHFSIRDTGIGIPAGKLRSIFESFAQADSSVTRHYGGTGLGITISQKLVGMMGGRMWAESKVEKGSVFHFTARFPIVDRHVPPPPPPADMRGMRVLVIDDNPTNRLIVRETLAAWGAAVDEAPGGPQGILKIREALDRKEPYTLLIIDRRMPGMDGFQTAEVLASEHALSGIIIIMLTSDDRKEDVPRAEKLGIKAYLVKPVSRKKLMESISGAFAREQPAEPEPVAEEQCHSMKILLVEDSEDNWLLMKAYFSKTSCELDLAVNGEEALEKFKQGGYDLVLMDMQMPVMDGYTATAKIREFEKGRGLGRTPVIALTAHAMKGDEAKSIEAGCDAHLSKPVRKKDLFQAIRSIKKR